jgi:hypothetical protein
VLNSNSLLQSLRMLEDESIQDYHLNIFDIANSFVSLGEKISDEKLVRKFFKSLPVLAKSTVRILGFRIVC